MAGRVHGGGDCHSDGLLRLPSQTISNLVAYTFPPQLLLSQVRIKIYMGQIPQDGENGLFVSLFFKK